MGGARAPLGLEQMIDHEGADTAEGGGFDPIPLLPRGALVFESIPLRAIVVEALTPAIGDGTLVVRDGERGAVILVRGGTVLEAHILDGDGSRTGSGLLREIQTWGDASVWAERLGSSLVDLCGTLLHGDTLYDDLRLSWTHWPSLLADLARRRGAYVVEITTPVGRGVTCMADGRQALSYTDIHPSLGDPALLEAMASNKEGMVRVRRVAAEHFQVELELDGAPHGHAGRDHAGPRLAAPMGAPAADGSSPSVPRATDTEQLAAPSRQWPSTTWNRTDPVGETDEAAEADLTAAATEAGALTDVAWVPPWEARWREAPEATAEPATTAPTYAQWKANTAAVPSGPVTVGEVLDHLRRIAQRRLQMSASRVEAVLDEGAQEQRPVGPVLDEIRAMSIRGVMPATVADMVDEMIAAVEQRPG